LIILHFSASHSCVFLFDGHPCQYPGGIIAASFLPVQKEFHHRELLEQILVEDLGNRTFSTRTDKTIKPNKKDSIHLRMSPMKRFICINYNVTIRKKQQYKSFDLAVKGYNFSIYVYEVLFEHPLSMFSDIILTPILDILIDNIFFSFWQFRRKI
jgi:hypothetical protein